MPRPFTLYNRCVVSPSSHSSSPLCRTHLLRLAVVPQAYRPLPHDLRRPLHLVMAASSAAPVPLDFAVWQHAVAMGGAESVTLARYRKEQPPYMVLREVSAVLGDGH